MKQGNATEYRTEETNSKEQQALINGNHAIRGKDNTGNLNSMVNHVPGIQIARKET